MTDFFQAVQPSPAAEKAILATQLAAEKRLQSAARFLLQNKLPAGGVLYQMQLPSPSIHYELVMQVRWPGELVVLKTGLGLTESSSFADAERRMPDRLQQLRAHCPAERVLLKAYMRRAHTTPMRLQLDACGVLRVLHARTNKVLAVSVPGNPFKLSPAFKARIFQNLMSTIR